MKTLAARSIIALCIGLALSQVGCVGPDDTAREGSFEPGAATDFKLDSLAGAKLGPADFAGQVVLVEFWATWCTPCHKQAAILSEMYPAFRDRGVEFLAVSVGEPEDVVRSFVEDRPFPYPVLFDPEDRVSVELGIHALPTVMILDRNREIVYFSPGVADEDTVRRALEEAGA